MSAYLALAQQLHERSDAILEKWLKATVRSPEVECTEEVTLIQLRDHVPRLLDDLSERLREHTGTADRETAHDAAAHGYFRWQQGYDLAAVLRELSLLRAVLIDELHEFKMAGGADAGPSRALHSFMDDVVRISTLRFAEEQQAALRKVSDSRMGLLRTVSHELRNAVNAIHLILVLQREEEDVKEQERCRESLDRTVDNLCELLNDLLHFSQLADGGLKAECSLIEPAVLARDLAESCRRECRENGLTFELEVDPTLGMIECDLSKLRQIANNLLGNAVKYTPAGGVVLRVLSVDATNWSLQVSDTGMGISQDVQAQLFEEFFRAPGTEKIRGTGLGLAICKRLVELLGGTIRVESKEHEGSTFEAILPKRR